MGETKNYGKVREGARWCIYSTGEENDVGGYYTWASTAVARGSLRKFGIIHYEGPNRGRRTSTHIRRSHPNDATIMD